MYYDILNNNCYAQQNKKPAKPATTTSMQKTTQEAKDRKRILKYYTCTSRERLIHSGRVYIIYVHASRAYKNTNKALGTRVYTHFIKNY